MILEPVTALDKARTGLFFVYVAFFGFAFLLSIRLVFNFFLIKKKAQQEGSSIKANKKKDWHWAFACVFIGVCLGVVRAVAFGVNLVVFTRLLFYDGQGGITTQFFLDLLPETLFLCLNSFIVRRWILVYNAAFVSPNQRKSDKAINRLFFSFLFLTVTIFAALIIAAYLAQTPYYTTIYWRTSFLAAMDCFFLLSYAFGFKLVWEVRKMQVKSPQALASARRVLAISVICTLCLFFKLLYQITLDDQLFQQLEAQAISKQTYSIYFGLYFALFEIIPGTVILSSMKFKSASKNAKQLDTSRILEQNMNIISLGHTFPSASASASSASPSVPIAAAKVSYDDYPASPASLPFRGPAYSARDSSRV